METIEEITVSGQYLTASLLIWRRFKKPMPGLLERMLALNPKLAEAGIFIPVGTIVRLPIPAEKLTTDVQPIRLWG